MMLKRIPDGYAEILDTFGNPLLAGWGVNLVTFSLPFSLRYMEHIIRRATCHVKAQEHFLQAFENIKCEGLEEHVREYGGIYSARTKRGSNGQLSTHAFGIAIDLCPSQYPLGSDKRLPAEVISCFTKVGFFYGGDFNGRKDPMHFQLCTGY